MLRLSRIQTPRASLVTIILLAIVLLAFGALADACHPVLETPIAAPASVAHPPLGALSSTRRAR